MVLLGSDTSSSYLTSLYLSGERADRSIMSPDDKCNVVSNMSQNYKKQTFLHILCSILLGISSRTEKNLESLVLTESGTEGHVPNE